jgi:hypothetical protein
MKRISWLTCLLLPLSLLAQDTTTKDPFKELNAQIKPAKRVVQVFSNDRLINTNTTELTGRGKLDFKVAHNFDDIVANEVNGNRGGVKTFFGLDNSTDVRIGFNLGLTDRLDLIAGRAKGGGVYTKTGVPQLWELGLKYVLLQQTEGDHSHPLSLAIFVNNVISSVNSFYPTVSFDTSLNQPYTFKNFKERNSQVVQLIVAQKIKRTSWLLNFSMVNQGYVPLNDQKTVFAIGGAIRLPLSKRMNLIVDYIHPFRTKASRDYFNSKDDIYAPPFNIDQNQKPFKFSDPLGVGLEIITAGHVFHLNFSNATSIIDNRVIPYTTTSWGKGQFRWCFSIARKFVIWRPKEKIAP